jgi:hypothetical protein
MIPEIKPLKKGAPEANEIPRQSGSATKKTTSPAGRSFFKYLKVNPFGFSITKEIKMSLPVLVQILIRKTIL